METLADLIRRMEAEGNIVSNVAVNPAAFVADDKKDTVSPKRKNGKPRLKHNAFAMNEADFQAMVIRFAVIHGWHYMHIRPGRVMRDGVEKYETAYDADSNGWPDLVLVRDRIVYAELKSDVGVLTDGQERWLGWLAFAGAEKYVWKPKDWTKITEVLK